MNDKSIIKEVRAEERQRLDDGQRAQIALAERRAKGMGDGGHFDDWIIVGRALMVGRLYVRRAYDAERGGRYNMLFARWKQAHPALLALDEGKAFSHSMWLLEDIDIYPADVNPPRLAKLIELREAMTPGQRANINHPTTMFKLVKAAMDAEKNAVKEQPSEFEEMLAQGKAEIRKAKAVRRALEAIAPHVLPHVLLELPDELLEAIRRAVCPAVQRLLPPPASKDYATDSA